MGEERNKCSCGCHEPKKCDWEKETTDCDCIKKPHHKCHKCGSECEICPVCHEPNCHHCDCKCKCKKHPKHC